MKVARNAAGRSATKVAAAQPYRARISKCSLRRRMDDEAAVKAYSESARANPNAFLIGSSLKQVVGWFLAGLAIAWWLGRRHR